MKSLIKCCGLITFGFITSSILSNANAEIKVKGSASLEQRLFLDTPAQPMFPVDNDYPYPVYHQISAALSPYVEASSARNNMVYTMHPFVRIDERDDKRTHIDFREFKAAVVTKKWQASIGFDQVYWGVMENHHLVDIVNQTDYLESPNGEDKLGQPMFKLGINLQGALLEAMLLVGYREPAVPTAGARFSFGNDYSYEYAGWGGEYHPDVALRYSKSIKSIDVGVSYFGGHSRTPELRNQAVGDPIWYVNLVDQMSIDIQADLNRLILKAEVLYKIIDDESTRAAVLGSEFKLLQTQNLGINLLAEYSWDQHGEQAFDNSFQNDIFAGVRVNLTGLNDSEILIGHNYDFDFNSQHGFVQAKVHVTKTLSVGLEGWWFNISDDDYANKSYNDDNMIQLTGYYNF
ncbi:MAG: hypothetical protein QNK26_04270 [Moritella sp.]|uniref:hypothetical protein n=1 Tax=Moritella sp. TaxID=78556 RepID=UPI0029B79421|nr:hypothetical protein [Moritella sp.]MDX2319793.1 hypothetical protein [Moritella sp.]